MYWLSGLLVCLDGHLPRPGGTGEELELPTGQETLTALRTGEGGGEGVGGVTSIILFKEYLNCAIIIST